MKQIPESFLAELRKTINAELFKTNNVSDILYQDKISHEMDTEGVLIYLYDYSLRKCVVLNGEITGLLGYSTPFNADIFNLGYEISNTTEVDEFLCHINEEANSYCTEFMKHNELKALKFSFEFNAKRVRKDHAWLLHHMHIVSVDENGLPLISYNMIHDITDFKRDEKMHFVISRKESDQLYTPVMKMSTPPLIKKSFFSERETQILNLVKNGKSSHEIAKILFISEHTVKQHRKNMLKKFKAKNTAALVSMLEG